MIFYSQKLSCTLYLLLLTNSAWSYMLDESCRRRKSAVTHFVTAYENRRRILYRSRSEHHRDGHQPGIRVLWSRLWAHWGIHIGQNREQYSALYGCNVRKRLAVKVEERRSKYSFQKTQEYILSNICHLARIEEVLTVRQYVNTPVQVHPRTKEVVCVQPDWKTSRLSWIFVDILLRPTTFHY